MMETALLDQVRVARLAAEVEDLTGREAAALMRVALRLEAELHRQTTFNRYLIDAPLLWVWPPGTTIPEGGGMFEVPSQVWETPGRSSVVLAHAHADALPAARLALGDPMRSLRGVWCTYPPHALGPDPHPKDCVCRGLGIARHLREDVLPGGQPWLLLSQDLAERVIA
jgi:hypothetical protein